MDASSSSEDDIIVSYWYLKRKKRKQRSCWIRESARKLIIHSANICAADLILYSSDFQNCYRMTPETFNELLNLIGASIEKEDTNYRESIPAKERLLITLM